MFQKKNFLSHKTRWCFKKYPPFERSTFFHLQRFGFSPPKDGQRHPFNFLHQNHRQLSISGWLHQAHVKGRHLQVKLKSASVQKYHLSGPSKDISKEYLEELGLTNDDYVEILGCIET